MSALVAYCWAIQAVVPRYRAGIAIADGLILLR